MHLSLSTKEAYKDPIEEAPCRAGCPAGVDVPRYCRLIAAGRFDEAIAVISEKVPFPAICGYICHHPCEIKCRLADIMGTPVAIKALKRFAAHCALKGSKQNLNPAPPTGKTVAIIGSGPAGLTAAYHLVKLGHKAAVFEALPQPGGMLRAGIPAYRLPRDILDAEIEDIKKAGVEIKTGTKVESGNSFLEQGYDAVFIALGAHRGIKIGIEGEDSPGVMDGLSFLSQVNLGEKPKIGDKVALVGGGNTAVDASRVALRLGAKEVTIVYRRSRSEMRANPEEIDQATDEGVRLMFLTIPEKITTQNGHLKLECLHTELGIKDADGRRLPQPIKGSEFAIGLDTVIVAVGQEPDIPLHQSLPLSQNNTILVDPDTLATPLTGIFAGGDCVSGPASVIDAIAAGKKAAVSIDKYLGGCGVIEYGLTTPEEMITAAELDYPVATATRHEIPLLSVTERLNDFAVVELHFQPETAVKEAKRCLKCDLPIVVNAANCQACRICEMVCSLRLEKVFSPSKAGIEISPVIRHDGKLDIQISFNDKCDCCGLCVRYCPSGALSRQGIKCTDEVTGKKYRSLSSRFLTPF